MQFLDKFQSYLELVEKEMRHLETYQDVPLFYDPIYYVLNLGGKKIRPLLLLLSCGASGGRIENAIGAAAAVELLHNFTLVHDDIMDNDDIRRGKPTIHVRWDISTAILSGDGLLGFAFQKLLKTPGSIRADLAERFTKAMIVICEGQALDKMFEQRDEVHPDQYMDMIARKTAALTSLSCELGAMIANPSGEKVQALKNYGHNLGMGFQLQDDLLDVYADEKMLGKKVGSDFVMHKKTILTLKLLQKIGKEKFAGINLQEYQQALRQHGIVEEIEQLSAEHFNLARLEIGVLTDSEFRTNLIELCDQIEMRSW